MRASELRREALKAHLAKSHQPQSGSLLGELLGVSRQIIVGDISLLKAQGLPIVSTPTGYLLVRESQSNLFTQLVECSHSGEDIKKELFAIVDCGVTVKDIKVKHPLYGFITAPLEISNRIEVKKFLKRMKETNAMPLSALTDKIHFHTLEADSEEKIAEAIKSLRAKGIVK